VISRRRLLLGGAAVVAAGGGAAYGLVDAGVVPGRSYLDQALGRCDVAAPWPHDAPHVSRADATFVSAARRRTAPYTVVRPAGVGGTLPLVLVLHGRGASAAEYVDGLHLDAFLAAHVAAGGRPFALACAQGGNGYWHPRADGDDPLRMLTGDLLPLLRRAHGVTTDPMGVLGWSMGGYGALLWARLAASGRLPAGARLTAAVAESPALFRSYATASRGAFDSAADFAEWGDLIRSPGVDPQVALRVDCGERDPFEATARAYRAAVRPEPAGGFTPGCHDGPYWRSRAAAQVTFLGDRLG
jgi:dienelactone hydrolase